MLSLPFTMRTFALFKITEKEDKIAPDSISLRIPWAFGPKSVYATSAIVFAVAHSNVAIWFHPACKLLGEAQHFRVPPNDDDSNEFEGIQPLMVRKILGMGALSGHGLHDGPGCAVIVGFQVAPPEAYLRYL